MKSYKNLLSATLALLLIVPQQALAETWAYRSAELSYSDYQSILKMRPDYQSPLAMIQQHIDKNPVPESIQNELDGVLILNSQNLETQCRELKKFHEKLGHEFQTKSILNLRDRIASRCQLSTTPKAQLPSSFNQWLLQTRQYTGFEDLAVFVNGQTYSANSRHSQDPLTQWMFVSSQKQPLLLTGTWDAIKSQIQMRDWVSGSCERPEIASFSTINGEHRALFNEACRSNREADAIQSVSDLPVHSYSTQKKWFWTALAVVGTIALISSASGKNMKVKSAF